MFAMLKQTRLTLAGSMIAALLVTAPQARAQQAASSPPQEAGVASANYLNPFPESDTWRAIVIGDGLAEGLLGGLIETSTV